MRDRPPSSPRIEGDLDPDGAESLILRVSNAFINLPSEEVDRKIVETLETLARFARAVRASVFLLSHDGVRITNTHEWCLDRSDSQQHLLQDIPFTHFGHYAGLLRRFSPVIVETLADLPPEAVGERRWIEEHGFRSLFFVPMRMLGELVGTLGFYGPVGEPRVWSRRYVDLLEFAAMAILNAIERRRYEDQRRELQEMTRASHLLRIEQALHSTTEAEPLMRRALDALLASFSGERALLLHPCDPDVPSWRVAMERGIHGLAGVTTARAEVPMDSATATFLRALRSSESPLSLDELPTSPLLDDRLRAESGLAVRIETQRRGPWALIVQRARGSEEWGAEDRALLKDIAWRIGDGLDAVSTFAELRESRARFMAIFDYAPVMIHSLDPDGRILLWNHDCEARLGWTREEIQRSDDPLALLLPAEEQRIRKRASIARADGAFQRFDVAARDGSSHVQSWADFRLPSGQVISVGHDLTEQIRGEEDRRELERRMLHTQKLESLGVLAGGIAHDFNNLLVGILGHLELALGSIEPASPANEHLKGVEQSALQLANLAGQMLAYSGRGAFVVEPVELSSLVEAMKPILTAAVDKKASIEFELAATIPTVVADPTQLRQVVLNLVVNGSEALEGRPGRIVVTTGVTTCDRELLRKTYVDDDLPAGEYVFLEVADTGAGMDAATRAQVFEPFYSTKFAGRGLGLAAVLGIARGHKGALRVESDLGRGSTFRLLLPASAEAVAPAPRPTPSGWRGSGVVLLADDEPMVRDVARRMIARLGFDVVTAANGEEAVKLFAERREEIVAVVLDVTMPVLDGREALVRIRSLDPAVPIVLSSGYARAAVLDDHATAFIQKPFTLATVESVLRSLF